MKTRALVMAAVALTLECREAPQDEGRQAPAQQELSSAIPEERKPPVIAVPAVEPPAPTANEEGEPTYRVGGEVSRPELIHRVDPDYARLNGRTLRPAGVPILEAIISETGTVESVRMLKPTNPELEAVLLEAVRQWRFRPALKDGKPVRVQYTLTTYIHWQ